MSAGNSYSHWCERLAGDMYRIGWTSTASPRKAHTTHTREQHRDTDYAGAVRFCKKWGIKPPPPLA